jgi:hypothetical protein
MTTAVTTAWLKQHIKNGNSKNNNMTTATATA